jgi:hypothetical protein
MQKDPLNLFKRRIVPVLKKRVAAPLPILPVPAAPPAKLPPSSPPPQRRRHLRKKKRRVLKPRVVEPRASEPQKPTRRVVVPEYYSPGQFDSEIELAPPLKIFMFGAHSTLMANERRLFERLGHQVYTVLDAWEIHDWIGVYEKSEYLAPEEVETIKNIASPNSYRITQDNGHRSQFLDLINRRFDVVYVTQLGEWLSLFKSISKPVVFRTYGRNNGRVLAATIGFDDLYVVPVHHEEEAGFPPNISVQPIMGSAEYILDEASQHTPIPKKDYYITVHRHLHRHLTLNRLPRKWPKWMMINAIRAPLPRKELLNRIQQAAVYIHYGGSKVVLKYAPIEAIALGTLAISMWGGALWGLQERWGFTRGGLVKTFFDSFTGGFDLAKYFSKNASLTKELAIKQREWLDQETKRARHQWNAIFNDIANKS